MTGTGRGTDGLGGTGGPAAGGTAAADGTTTTGAAAPGGTAVLAGRRVARIGFGAMQLERAGPGRAAALAVLRQAVGIVAEGDQKADLADQLAELVALREAGKIGGIGLSGVSAKQLGQALPAGIACVQNGYSVLDRSAEPVLEVCREHDIAWVPFFPLGSAFPGRPKAGDDPVVTAVAAGLGATAAQVALAWLLARYAIRC